MNDELRVAIGNAEETFRAIGQKSIEVSDYETAGKAFTIEGWLRAMRLGHASVSVEAAAKIETEAAPKKKRGRKPKGQSIPGTEANGNAEEAAFLKDVEGVVRETFDD